MRHTKNARPFRALVETLESRTLLAATLPAGFAESLVASGLTLPTAEVVTPDGRILVCEKGGTLRVIKNGQLLATPFLTLNVDTHLERGLDGIILDPNFAQNHYVYVYYTKYVPSNPNQSANGATNRLSRFTADPANPDVALAGSETVILDNIESWWGIHNGGAMAFAPDGKLFLAVGDGGHTTQPHPAQNLLTFNGKVLRIDVNHPGSPPTDNPYYNAADGITAADYTWAIGFRNPYTGAILPGTNTVYINDVGQDTWEEVDQLAKGANYGWPNAEGPSNNAAYTNPVYTYNHNGAGAAITGGMFYSGTQFPAAYSGKYFFGDFVQGKIRMLDPTTHQETDFATNAPSPVDFDMAPDGSIYYLSLNDGAVYKISYVAGANRPPVAAIGADVTNGLAPLTVNFTAAGSTDPDGNPLTYTWDYGDSSPHGSGLTAQHIYTVNGTYTATVTAFDGLGGSNSASLTITVGNRAPTATITSPVANSPYQSGDTISFSGTGTDPEDGTLPASAFHWSMVFHHNTHTHPFITAIDGVTSGTFQIPTGGETDTNQWYRIHLTVTDSGGLTNSTYIDILPQTANITLATNPPGLLVKLDDIPHTAPYTEGSVINYQHSLEAPAREALNGQSYDFVSWSDGGASLHTLPGPATDTTYTATYQPVAGGGLTGTYFKGTALTTPVLTRVDPAINFTWTGIAPDPALPTTNYSVRWTGKIVPLYSDTYTFYTSSDDGVRLWVNNQLLVNNWTTHPATENTGTIALVAGQQYDIRMEYYQAAGGAVAQLSWSSATQPKEIVPNGQLIPAAPPVQAPFGGSPLPVTSTIEAENFDTGGQGVAYFDTTPANLGGAYRLTDAVDIQPSTDTAGGYNVGWTQAGEWLEYTVSVPTAGSYLLTARVASAGAGGTFHVLVDGTDVTGTMTVPNTGGWQTWTNVTQAVTLPAGVHVLRLSMDASGATGFVGNFNWMQFAAGAVGRSPYGGSPAAIPGTIEAENFDNGGAGVAYSDTTATNEGNAYRATGVDIEATTDAGGGYNVGWTRPGEWMEYTVNVATAGTYTLDVRVASAGVGGTFNILAAGADITGPMAVPNTGGWQTWTTLSKTVTLTAGPQVLRLAFATAGPSGFVGNFNWMRFT